MRIICETENLPQKAVVEFVKISERHEGVLRLFMFSGGSALEIVKNLPKDFFRLNDTVTVLDERYTQNKADSNFAALADLIGGQCQTIDPRPKDAESLKGVAERFEKELRNWRKENPNGKIIITQGIGEDGHTAGILPFPEDKKIFAKFFEDDKRWVCGYEVSARKNPYTKRITVTASFLTSEVSESLVYVSGEKKRNILDRLVSGKDEIYFIPAVVIKKMKNVVIITDIY